MRTRDISIIYYISLLYFQTNLEPNSFLLEALIYHVVKFNFPHLVAC